VSEDVAVTEQDSLSHGPWKHCYTLLLCYLAPLLLLGSVYFRVDPGLGSIFWRNLFRAGCGPICKIMVRNGFDPNDFTTYAVAFSIIWPAWLLIVCFSPLGRLPVVLHAILGFLWSLGGCLLTLAS